MGSFVNTSNKNNYFIGLMSGTSLDGIDVVLCHIKSKRKFSLVCAESYPIAEQLKTRLLSLSQEQQYNELDCYAELDVQMGALFAQCCLSFLAQHNIKAEQVHAIGCHGQTLRHYPEHQYPTTLQIGDPNIIAQQTGICCIADFRRRDIAAGGQGAPLVPPFHQAIFASRTNRAIVNIGGIANVTFLPASSETSDDSNSEVNNNILGYDTGPGNGLMDHWCSLHFNCAYDRSGKLARQGVVDKKLLELFLSEPFFSQIAPKSTGREYFSLQWVTKHIKELYPTYTSPNSHYDILATLLELSCVSISNEVLLLRPKVNELLICGGGASNIFLMQRLQALMPAIKVSSTEEHGLHPDWVEAGAFAWLAHQTLHGLSSNLTSVTGAKNNVILGAIWQA